jgi:3-dehydroquinate synthase
MREIEQSFALRLAYPVLFTHGVLREGNAALERAVLRAGPGPHRLLPVIDGGVLEAWPALPEQLSAYCRSHPTLELARPPHVLPGGEACKSDPRVIDEIHALIAEHGICRHSFILAIGGGSVLDAAGYAAATAHRGVRLLRLPTTVLAQNDAGIGVKNAVNFRRRKNFLGTFVPPFAVINDLDFLETLDPRDRRAGIAEAIKVSLIKDAEFFALLHGKRARLAAFEREAMGEMIVRCAELHLEHIRTSGDPFELGSARPLDFGHWAAHKLEELSEHELRHGEAVAIGIALDTLYSQAKGMLSERDAHRVLEALRDTGFALSHPALEHLDVEAALEDFRVHLGGELCITLLAGIGRGVEVREVDASEMRRCRARLRDFSAA